MGTNEQHEHLHSPKNHEHMYPKRFYILPSPPNGLVATGCDTSAPTKYNTTKSNTIRTVVKSLGAMGAGGTLPPELLW